MSKKHGRKKKQMKVTIKRTEKKAPNPPREKTRKEVIVWEATGIIMLVLAFASIIIPAILCDSEGYLGYGWIFLVLFFFCASAVLRYWSTYYHMWRCMIWIVNGMNTGTRRQRK